MQKVAFSIHHPQVSPESGQKHLMSMNLLQAPDAGEITKNTCGWLDGLQNRTQIRVWKGQELVQTEG